VVALSMQPKKIWLEVVVLWAIAIALIAGFGLLRFIPFVRENLWGIAGIVFLFLPIEYLHRKGADLAVYGLTWRHLGRGLLWAGIFMAIAFPPYILGYEWWFDRHQFSFALPDTFWQEVVGNLFLVALPEEAFYRGYMQTRLDQVFRGRIRILGAPVGWSLVVTAGFFAIGHLVEFRPDKLGTFFPGLVFGWLRAKTGSIGGAVVFHAGCNIWAQILRYGYFGV
jgi:hypothetical protein